LLPIGHVAPWFANTGETGPEPTQDVRATAAVRYVNATLFKLFAQRCVASVGSTRPACVVDNTEPSCRPGPGGAGGWMASGMSDAGAEPAGVQLPASGLRTVTSAKPAPAERASAVQAPAGTLL